MKTRKLIEVVGIIAVLVVAISLIFVEVRVYGTGFNGYTIITTSKTTSGASPSTITSTTQSQPGKTLWDWLQLLIIPIVLTIGGFWLNQIQKGREQRIIEQRDKTEREIALDNQREVALQAYIDNMSELLLEKKLRESKPEDEVRKIARVRTLTVLPRLDAKRKGRVLQFIYEAGLIDKGRPIIDLKGANLREASLNGANLREADLHQADMYKVDLFRANLIGANLSGANLCQAHMDQADLSSADLSETILMSALLFQTNFSRACLSRVLLAGAFMIETNLEGTTITLEELDGVDSLMGAIMPDGSIHS